jgi:hypothetical protein
MPSGLRAAAYDGPLAVVTRRLVRAEEGSMEALPPGAISGSEETPIDTEPAPEIDTQPSNAHTLTAIMRKSGYRVTRQLSEDVRLAVSNFPTAELLEWVREGGNLVFI